MKKFITTVALAGILAFTGSASAQTSGDLQAQIDALLAQLAAMQGTTTTVTGPAFVFSGTMRPGMSGPGVSTLQASLNSVQDPDLVVDGAYGPATAAAVKQFQASQGLAIDGIVGPNTGAALTAASTTTIIVGTDGDLPEGCTSTSGYSSTTGEKCDEGTTPSGFPTTGGDEASLSKFSFDSEDDAEEGKMAHVATVEFDVEDGDVMVERFDLTFEFAGTTANGADDEPWDVFDTITLMADGDEIAEMDIDDEDDWNEDNSPFVFRVSGLDYVVEEGDTAEIEVYLTAANNVDVPADADWDIYVANDGIRTIDTAGITDYIGKASDVVSLSMDEEGGDEDIKIKSSSNDPKSSLLLVDATKKSESHETFVFRLEAEENDIDLEELVLSFDAGTSTDYYNTIVDEVTVEIDGDEYDVDDVEYFSDAAYTTSTGTTPDRYALLSFDIDGDTTIDGDDEAEVTVMAQFKKADGTNYSDGQTVKFGVRSVDGEGVDDVDDVSTLQGEMHTLSLAAAEITNVSWVVTESQNSANGTIDFFFTVDNSDGDENFDVVASAVMDTATAAFVDAANWDTASGEGVLTQVGGDTAVVDDPNDTYTVLEGESTRFRVRYTATALGTYEATITEVAGVEIADDEQLSPSLIL